MASKMLFLFGVGFIISLVSQNVSAQNPADIGVKLPTPALTTTTTDDKPARSPKTVILVAPNGNAAIVVDGRVMGVTKDFKQAANKPTG